MFTDNMQVKFTNISETDKQNKRKKRNSTKQ